MVNKFTISSIVLLLSALLIRGTDKRITATYRFAEPKKNVCVAVEIPSRVRSIEVVVNGSEVASQIDTLDSFDGKGERNLYAVYVFDAKAGRNKAVIKCSYSASARPSCEPRVHAQMFLKNRDGSLAAIRTVTEGADTMYNRLHHHGPAFENEFAGYRIYFDKKQTVDLYGKRFRGLELARTMWYPTAEQLASGAGDDVIRVFGSVGVGTLKGWDSVNGKAVHIAPFAKRTARIAACGPVRTVVEMQTEGWLYAGRLITLTSRYILWGGRRECEVQNLIEGDREGLVFCTGVQKIARCTPFAAPDAMAVWGTDYPQNDTLRYAPETVGLALFKTDPHQDWSRRVEDNLNYLVLLSPDKNGRIDYEISFVAAKEEWEHWTEESFFAYVEEHEAGPAK